MGEASHAPNNLQPLNKVSGKNGKSRSDVAEMEKTYGKQASAMRKGLKEHKVYLEWHNSHLDAVKQALGEGKPIPDNVSRAAPVLEASGRFDGRPGQAAREAAPSQQNDKPEPTQAQKELGNYAKGHAIVQGMPVSIKNTKGSTRSGVRPDGKSWSNEMKSHNGYFEGTVGKDKDHVDVFLGPKAETAGTAYVANQIDPKTGEQDEHKVIRLRLPGSRREASLENYDEDWKGLG